ncbi:MFS transporter [uncultured Brachybacterium sp.]|uniref:MFS transporter n=1 Tax=uncultured Brachybacterium sp. TaxID=189680 RepID=UPI002608A1C2|nr:MFS transporter [uncultured Brachybacterium sp.]
MSARATSGDAFSDPAFRWLWGATILAQTGSSLGSVAIPLIAINELGMNEATVALLATSSAVVLLVAAFPAGYIAEFRRKRPLMIGAALVRATMFTVIAMLLLTGSLHVAWMFVALGLNAAMQILFSSASSAHTKSLLDPEHRADALGKLQAANWTSLILGPVVAGLIAGVSSPAVLLLGNAAAFILSAALVRGIPRPEGPAPARGKSSRRGREAIAGAHFLLREPMLRRLFLSWLIFAGAVAALTPITQVFYIQDLQFTEVQYGLLMGLPSLGGLIGAWVTGRIARRWRLGPTVWWSSILRTPWYLLYPLAQPGISGFVMLLLAFTGVLFFSSITNSAMGALRMELTPDHLMSRSSAAWGIATMGAGPALIPILGFVMQATNARTALWAIFALVTVSLLVLPVRRLNSAQATEL